MLPVARSLDVVLVVQFFVAEPEVAALVLFEVVQTTSCYSGAA